MNNKIQYALVQYANSTAQCVCYNWNSDFQAKELKETYDRLQRVIQKENLDFLNMTVKELEEYGFIKWSKGSNPIMLIPLYLMSAFKEGTELTCIDGTKAIVGKDYIDNDTRVGCIAYGIYAKEV